MSILLSVGSKKKLGKESEKNTQESIFPYDAEEMLDGLNI